MKKTLAVFLASFVAVALLTSSAFADSDEKKDKRESTNQQKSLKENDRNEKEKTNASDTIMENADLSGEITGTVSDDADKQAKERLKEAKEEMKETKKQMKETKKQMKEAIKEWKDTIKEAIKQAKEAAKEEEEDEDEDEEESTVTEDTYGHKGYIGLQKALENVKNNPAGQVLTQLLKEKYGIDASQPEQVFTVLADELDAEGETETAADLQKELIKAEVKNLELYKKLGKMYEKLGKKGIKAFVNGEEPNFEVPPVIKDGTTLVPFRAISEALKAEVTWNPDERSVTVTRNGVTVKLLIGDKTAYVNGETVELEVPGEIKEGSTMVPVRFISEALKAVVNWEAESQSVVIYEENK